MATPETEKELCAEFEAGKTTTELSAKYEMTRQGVHRILKKNGLTRANGGKSKAVADRKAQEATIPSTLADRHGCSPEQWEQLRAMDEDYKKTPLSAFNTFKNNFQNLYKEVVFDMTLWEWWTLWEESGRWAQHARNPEGMWVMAQIDRALPLTKNNARIIPFGQLMKETRKPKSAAANDGVEVAVAAL